jgi:hypothetical protein
LDSCEKIYLLEDARKVEMTDNLSRLYEEHFRLIEKIKLLFKLSANNGEIELMSKIYQGIESDLSIGIVMPKDYTP